MVFKVFNAFFVMVLMTVLGLALSGLPKASSLLLPILPRWNF
jgi:hypothetical protein